MPTQRPTDSSTRTPHPTWTAPAPTRGTELAPGLQYINIQTGKSCSIGFFAQPTTATDHLPTHILTAGHCGTPGQTIRTPSSAAPIGRITASLWNRDEHSITGPDIGLIELTPEASQAADPTIPVLNTARTTWSYHHARTKPVITTGLDTTDTLIRIGYRTGASAGTFDNSETCAHVQTDTERFCYSGTAQHGDSGGPIYTLSPTNEVIAVGIQSYQTDDTPHSPEGKPLIGQYITEYATQNGLQLI
ncbi:trypsin-like serine protease [Gordonia sihwensis]|uniref:trypsin-like serine protease n=1 Tax=Gordonia sihwensis TaxID=173559 RepID=UPI003D95C4AD